jgi:hypothetical protein
MKEFFVFVFLGVTLSVFVSLVSARWGRGFLEERNDAVQETHHHSRKAALPLSSQKKTFGILAFLLWIRSTVMNEKEQTWYLLRIIHQ